MMTRHIYRCPVCGRDKVRVLAYVSVAVNPNINPQERQRVYTEDARWDLHVDAWCLDCTWTGLAKNLDCAEEEVA